MLVNWNDTINLSRKKIFSDKNFFKILFNFQSFLDFSKNFHKNSLVDTFINNLRKQAGVKLTIYCTTPVFKIR